MSKLKKIRENLNLTQEEVSEKSGVSARTIQRIEAGIQPKGQTLKLLAKALEINPKDLLDNKKEVIEPDLTFVKLVNLSSIVFTTFPPANILVPWIIVFIKKKFDPLTKQIISVQIIWSIVAFIIFMLSAFIRNWFSLKGSFTLIVMILLVLSNVIIILRNAAEIDKKQKLFFKLNFSLI